MRRTPLKRRTKLARGDSELVCTAKLERRSKIRPVNRERRARLEEAQFGEYGDVISAQACWVTGLVPVDRAHVTRKRSLGGGPEDLAALQRPVHVDFDDELLSDQAFFRRWKVSRADIRARAVEEYARWLAREEALCS